MKALILLASYWLSLVVATPVIHEVPKTSNKISYKDDKVIRLRVGDNVAKVNSLIKNLSLSSWNGDPQANKYVDLLVPRSKLVAFANLTASMETHVMHEDLGASIKKEAEYKPYAGSATLDWFESYHPYADHLRFLSDLQSQYNANSEIVVAGNTTQGQQITGIHIYGKDGKGENPAVVFYATLHAREWITTMVVEYIALQLLSNYGKDVEITDIVDTQDVYIYPVVNPDGFVYSQTVKRLWRKNRQPLGDGTNFTCPQEELAEDTSGNGDGRDLNRNWPHEWNTTRGASDDPCSLVFRGLSPGDATETPVLTSILDNLASETGLKLFIDFHSYSQLFLFPYGYDCQTIAATSEELLSLATGVADSIKAVKGTDFQTGSICKTLTVASGNGVDYSYDVAKADYSYVFELRDTGEYGFVLPADQILPSGEETFAGVKYLLAEAK